MVLLNDLLCLDFTMFGVKRMLLCTFMFIICVLIYVSTKIECIIEIRIILLD